MRVFWLFRVECGGAGVGRGLRVEVEVLDDERTSTPAVFKDLDNVVARLGQNRRGKCNQGER